MTRDEIIDSTSCPICYATPGYRCLHTGKKANQKMRQQVSHMERMKEAQDMEAQKFYQELIDEEDCG